MEACLERKTDRPVDLVSARRHLAASSSRPLELSGGEAPFVRARRPCKQGQGIDGERSVGETRLDGREGGERRAELLPRASVLHRELESATCQTGEIGQSRGAPGPPACSGGHRFELATDRDLDPHRPATVERQLGTRLRARSAEGEPAMPERQRKGAHSEPVARPAVDRERRSQRDLVDQAGGSHGTPELQPPDYGSAEQLGTGPELGPSGRREAGSKFVVAVVLPHGEVRLAWQLPLADRQAHRLAEEAELVRDVERHASSLRTTSVSAPRTGADSAPRLFSPIRMNGASKRTLPNPGCSTSPTRWLATT